MTVQQLLDEWQVEYLTRIGNLCGTGTPTPEQEKISSDEADEHIAKLKSQGDKTVHC